MSNKHRAPQARATFPLQIFEEKKKKGRGLGCLALFHLGLMWALSSSDAGELTRFTRCLERGFLENSCSRSDHSIFGLEKLEIRLVTPATPPHLCSLPVDVINHLSAPAPFHSLRISSQHSVNFLLLPILYIHPKMPFSSSYRAPSHPIPLSQAVARRRML